jgi:hypothetical protein
VAVMSGNKCADWAVGWMMEQSGLNSRVLNLHCPLVVGPSQLSLQALGCGENSCNEANNLPVSSAEFRN